MRTTSFTPNKHNHDVFFYSLLSCIAFLKHFCLWETITIAIGIPYGNPYIVMEFYWRCKQFMAQSVVREYNVEWVRKYNLLCCIMRKYEMEHK